ncbi:MAG: 2-dehydro-3-deoxyphosphogluconate aldolase [Candidatus Dormibacteraeota bacterium]|nr:2-dehydro-3-deoxyphosphogluconate aldolase [Candidatus Dormibacteraeota bacterium]
MITIEQAFPNRIAGVIRTDDGDAAYRACRAAIDGGVGTVEVTTGVPGWAGVVKRLVAESAGTPIGVGTVVQPQMVAEAVAAGASFVVTPFLQPEVAAAAREHGSFLVMGALTPTEIHQALHLHGAQVVKIYPIASVGGASYLRLISGPMPGMPLWVSGGVELEQVADYLRLGVKAVGLTTALFPPDAVRAGDTARITALAREAVSALAGVS